MQFPALLLVIIRFPLIKGVGAASLQGEIIALSLFAILIMGAAVSRFRKRLD
jgi:ABC-2 type transport system permease protein